MSKRNTSESAGFSRTVVIKLENFNVFAYKQQVKTNRPAIRLRYIDGRDNASVFTDAVGDRSLIGAGDPANFPEELIVEAAALLDMMPMRMSGEPMLFLDHETMAGTIYEVATNDVVKTSVTVEKILEGLKDLYDDKPIMQLSTDLLKFVSTSKLINSRIAEGDSSEDILNLIIRAKAQRDIIYAPVTPWEADCVLRRLKKIFPDRILTDVKALIYRKQMEIHRRR